MTSDRLYVILVGSPKKQSSATSSIASFLQKEFDKKAIRTKIINIHTALSSKEKELSLLEGLKDADTIIFATPLYVDCLPGKVIQCLELLSSKKDTLFQSAKPKLAAISVCGFPESSHNQTALSIYKIFAKEIGFQWLGGLGIGMGEAIKELEEPKYAFITKTVMKALTISAENLSLNKSIPEEAQKMLASPMMPAKAFIWIADKYWKKLARENRVIENINDTPFLQA